MMIFTRLELKNFKSHANTAIDFNPGISLIVGQNGAGKSTIFEAISFALFKVYGTKTINDLVRSNKNIKEKIEMIVKLSFYTNGEDYMVERGVTINKASSKSTSKLFQMINGNYEIIASGNKQVDESIGEILTMDSSTFLNAIHIRQGEISDLIDKTPAARKILIGKLLKLEKLEKAYENIPKISEDYKTRKAILEDRIQPGSEINFEFKKAQDEYFALNEENNQLKEEFEIIKKDIENKNKKKEELEKLKSDYEALQIKLGHENDNLKGLNNTKEELTKIYDKILTNENEMNLLKPFTEKLPIFKDFKESYDILKKFKDDEKSNKEMIAQIEEFKNTIESEKENHERFISLEGEIKALNNKKIALSAELKRINELELERDTLVKDIDQYNKDLDSFYNDAKTVLIEFDEEIEAIKTNDDLNNLESLVEGLRTELRNELEKINEKLEKLNNESFSLEQESKSLEEPLADIRKVENKCPVCQSDISEDKKNELIAMYEGTISNNSNRINANKEILVKLNNEKSLSDVKLNKLDSIKTKIYQNKHIVGDLDKFSTSLETVNVKINELQGKKEELAELEKIIDAKNNEFNELEPHNKKYLDANTLLKSYPDETKIKDELYSISGKINAEEDKLKTFIASDSLLSLEISDEKLDELINDYTEKDTKYHVLLGSIKDKEEYEERIKNNNEAIENKKNEILEINKAIETSPYDEENYRNMILLIERFNEKYNKTSQQIAVNNNNLKMHEDTLKDIEERIELNRKNKEEYVAVKAYYELLEDLRVFYSKDGIQGDLRRQSRPIIQKNSREFFEKFNFNYSDLILDNEYNISIFGPEGEVNIENVSGGEKIAIALSLRLGITQAMSKGNIETILLDEPTVHLDSYRRQELIEVLRSMSKIPQMLIVTHDSELETAADTLIRVTKEDGISKVEINT